MLPLPPQLQNSATSIKPNWLTDGKPCHLILINKITQGRQQQTLPEWPGDRPEPPILRPPLPGPDWGMASPKSAHPRQVNSDPNDLGQV
jgi:hypothetical protein